MAKTLLITGASGFLGQFLCDVAFQQTELWIVHGVVHSQPPPLTAAHFSHSVDLTDASATTRLLNIINPDAVIHAAALAHPAQCEQEPDLSYRINVQASQSLAHWCAQHNRALVFTSSEQVFAGDAPIFRLNDQPRPINVYGCHKHLAEQAIWALHPTATIARLPLMYSFEPGTKGFAQSTRSDLLTGRPVKAFIDEIRPPANVRDVAHALLAAIHLPSQLLHLGGPQALTRFAMASTLATVLKVNPDLVVSVKQDELSTGAARPRCLFLDSQSSWELVGIKPMTWAQSLNSIAL